jgi:hypothetical protein
MDIKRWCIAYNLYFYLKISAIILSQKSPSLWANEEQVVEVVTNLIRLSVFGYCLHSGRLHFWSR